MQFSKIFSSENILMSVGGHLALIAVLIASTALVVARAKLVAPDRIEIMEIDLDSVEITADDTKLYNTDVAPEKAIAKPETVPDVPEPVKEVMPPAPAAEEKPIETPSLIEEVPETKPVPAEKKPDEQPKVKDAPVIEKKKTVVRVNRSVMSVDRTLTVSVVDALRVALTRCWTVDTDYPGISDIRAVAHLTMRPTGTVMDVWFESESRAETDASFAYVLDTIRDALNVCQPFRMLPRSEFEKWEKIQLTFYPTQGKIM